jgi:hypothetical protein
MEITGFCVLGLIIALSLQSVTKRIADLTKSLERDSSKVQALLAEVRDKLSK